MVGNAQYQSQTKLRNPENDARDVTRALREADFRVIELENATLEQMAKAVNDFVTRIHVGDTALFYYSGHGMQIGGENYLAQSTCHSPMRLKPDSTA